MPVLDLFSHRKRVAEGKFPDVYSYDDLPNHLRVQIAQIWLDAIGSYYLYSSYELGSVTENNHGWKQIHDAVAREHGLFNLGNQPRLDERCINYLLNAKKVEQALDLIEVSFVYIDRVARGFDHFERRDRGINVAAGEAINELNKRFLRAAIGYQYDAGRIFRVDSELIHNEIIRPALRYLYQKGFEGPRDEFLRAHSHYRNGEMKNTIIDSNNAFESTLKVICEQKGWEYPNGARASDLIGIVRRNGLLPTYLENSFDQLAATLKSGLPKVRGEEGAHGQGAAPRRTPRYVAGYALHLAAAKILFLVEAHKASG